MLPTKACPVVLRPAPGGTELLVFRHPRAGVQLVKGTIEPGESAGGAAVRELAEEAGLLDAVPRKSLGVWRSGQDDQVWEFFEMDAGADLPDAWLHRAPDDGGLEFAFSWHPLREQPGPDWHPVFVRALAFVRSSLGSAAA
jgi:8-oxo-dGTP pyrophosphatase MutT (NUDIX family)